MKVRKSSRVILLNDQDEVCLFLHLERDRRYWILPGGEVDPGESWEAAAIRELWEETGLRDVVLGPRVWTREKVVMLFGEWTRGVERYFLARVEGAEVSKTPTSSITNGRCITRPAGGRSMRSGRPPRRSIRKD